MPATRPTKTRRAGVAGVALLLCLGLWGCAGVPAARPEIIEVAAWGGEPTASPSEPQRITRITLHHQGESFAPQGDVAAYLRRLQQWSRLSKRWVDIPYHYVIAPDGRMYAARPPAIAGDTNTEYDPGGHALVMLLGNFEVDRPTQAQLQATVVLLAWLVRRHGLDPDAIATHRDFSGQTVCPGKNFYALVASGWLGRAVRSRLSGSPPP